MDTLAQAELVTTGPKDVHPPLTLLLSRSGLRCQKERSSLQAATRCRFYKYPSASALSSETPKHAYTSTQRLRLTPGQDVIGRFIELLRSETDYFLVRAPNLVAQSVDIDQQPALSAGVGRISRAFSHRRLLFVH